ncbi:MAG: ABC transporter substrate-binding protein [Burkholderiales bacterium]|nr:MAG: ABC transporter substrate-binding protein [Burkholderiales bacterium]
MRLPARNPIECTPLESVRMRLSQKIRLLRAVLGLGLWFFSQAAGAAHAIAWGEEPRYGPGFSHFDYVNPEAPRGGSAVLNGFGSFDKLNPFTLRGIAAAGLSELMFDTLAEQSWDEPFSMYGLIARDMEFAADGMSITFHVDPRARFNDGTPITAEDVRYSFETLLSRQAHPRYRNYFADVRRAVVTGPLSIRFEFHRLNHELHMILGQLPVFSRRWGEGKPFDKIVQDAPIASSPYLIDGVDWGRGITYRRNPDYWAAELPARRGMYNFERVVYKYFKDEFARLEGFKAGEFDWLAENAAKNWARGHVGPRFERGELIKREFAHSNAAGLQGFGLNLRRPLFRDKRVRQALTLAMDFEWMNRQLFYGQYTRSPSYFTNSDMAASGRPGPEELAVLEPLREGLDPAVFGEVPVPPSTALPSSLRANLRQALRLLEEAGWRIGDDGRLRNAQGQPFEFEILSYSKALERVAVPWVRCLEKLGIAVRMRVTDPALYQKRLDDFDFEVTVVLFGASQTPGNELIDRFSSKAALERGSENYLGISDPVVDALIEGLLRSGSRRELVVAARALDRVLRHGYYVVPHFHIASHRVSYDAKFGIPEPLPLYYGAEAWMLKTWWVRPEAR